MYMGILVSFYHWFNILLEVSHMGEFLMDEFLDDADFYESDDFENSGCIVNISRYNNNVADDLDAGDAPEFETEEK